MGISRRLQIACAFSCALLIGGAGRPQDLQRRAIGPTVRLTLRAVATPSGGAAFEAGTADTDLTVGDNGALTFAIGSTLCERAIGTRPRAAGLIAWTVEGRIVNAATDRIAFDLTIDRRANASAVRRDIRHVVLAEGAPHTLDFIEANDVDLGACPIKNIVLDISASIVAAKRSTADVLTFDLWVVHRDEGGARRTQHETRVATDGEAVPFRFRPLRFPVNGVIAGAVDVTVDQNVSGTVRARRRADGSEDVSLTVLRDFSTREGSVGERGGPKVFSARLDEPVAIELPSPRGVMAILPAPGKQRQRLSLSELLADHATEVIVVVHDGDH